MSETSTGEVSRELEMLGITLISLFGSAILYLLTVLCRRKRKDGEPPLINGWIPYIGKAFEFGKDAYKFLAAHKETHGDVFTVRIAGKYVTFIMDPVLYPAVIKHGKQLDFHEFSDKVAPLTFGYPPLRSTGFQGLGDRIQRSYRLLQGQDLASLTENVTRNLLLVLRQDYMDEGDQWRTAKMYKFCCRVMFEATFLTMFGKPLHGDRHAGMETMQEKFEKFDAMFPLLIARIPISLLGTTKAVREDLIGYFLPQRMAEWGPSSQFIQHRREIFEDYHTLGERDTAAHHFAILWASVGNTVPSAFWAMYHLVTHPKALACVREEIHSVLRDGGEGVGPRLDGGLSQQQLDSLLFMGSAINESLRLSSASMNIRVAQENFSLRLDPDRSVAVRKGDFVALYPQSMHMDPEIFEDPEVYKFDRFVEDGQEKTGFYKHGQKLKYYRMPFGSGATQCPGRHFALNEIKQFLALLLLHFDMEVPEGQSRVGLDKSRVGLGILLPSSDIVFRYRTLRLTRT